ncbi:hypothetical protein BDW68DRAFT_183374 [Aspergillus falconensis]
MRGQNEQMCLGPFSEASWHGIPRLGATVTSLLETNICEHSPFLAYLSARGTGQIKDERFIDESIHLIRAFQLAGFRHVIGTLWNVNAETCMYMARKPRVFRGWIGDNSHPREQHKKPAQMLGLSKGGSGVVGAASATTMKTMSSPPPKMNGELVLSNAAT